MQPFMGNESGGRSVVVVGIDFSEPSKRALGVARSVLASAPDPELHIVHVFPALQTLGLGASAVGADALALEPVRQARALLDSAAQDLKGDRGRVVAHFRFGDAAREISQLASDVNANLVIVGTSGRRWLERMLLGSTAEGVVRLAPCTVITVRAQPERAYVEIEAPCPDCTAAQFESRGAKLWCARHAQHHSRAHLHYEYPSSFAVGAQTFRE